MFGLLRIALLYLIVVNVITLILFIWDKARAKQGQWRVAESTLLLFSAIGGTPAAFVGREIFRHKTRKQPFGYILIAIAVLQVVMVAGIVIYRTSSQVL